MTRSTLWVFCLLGTTIPIGCGQKQTQLAAPPTPTVSVAAPIEREVVNYEDFTGRTDAVASVDIRARVTGYLVKVAFKDGDIVKKDDLLYQIDPRPYQDALAGAQGTLERLEAEKKLLAIEVNRYRNLAEKGAGSQQDLDEYLGKQAENEGAINTAKAQLAQATLNLGFTDVTAPISGKLSRTLLTEGNLVSADATLLTTLMSIEPIYGYFSIEEPTMLRVRQMMRDGVLKSHDTHNVAVQMGLSNDVERKFPFRGNLDFVNNTVDPTTGTILVRGVFPNPYKMPEEPPILAPGMFVRVRLPVGPLHKVLLINERAVCADQGEKFVYVLDKDSKVSYCRVELGLLFGRLQAIESGIEAGQRVVVDGMQHVRPNVAAIGDEVDMTTLQSLAKTRPATPSQKPAAP